MTKPTTTTASPSTESAVAAAAPAPAAPAAATERRSSHNAHPTLPLLLPILLSLPTTAAALPAPSSSSSSSTTTNATTDAPPLVRPSPPLALNLAIGLTSLLLVAAYHAWLARRVARAPATTVFGLNANARRAWVASIMLKKQDILAVQSLRNWVMAATALASTAIVIIFGIVAFIASLATHADTTDPANPLSSDFGFVLDALFGYKVLAVLAVYMVSFACFVNAIRFYNHVGLVINISATHAQLATLTPQIPSRLPLAPSTVAAILNRGAFFYTCGQRGFYLSFPLIAYLWGPWPLAVATALLLAALRVLDFEVSEAEFEGGAGSGEREVRDEEARRARVRSAVGGGAEAAGEDAVKLSGAAVV
ncbi:hypothetical protein DFJ73DRAFT_921142 [Zopfochytrium polystomum]|nr:hypothetical protein DFJ73DRAFT_921142 [Zopfochytrium polystomum]